MGGGGVRERIVAVGRLNEIKTFTFMLRSSKCLCVAIFVCVLSRNVTTWKQRELTQLPSTCMKCLSARSETRWKTTCCTRKHSVNVQFHSLLLLDPWACLFLLFFFLLSKKSFFFFKDGLLNDDVPGMWGQQHFCPKPVTSQHAVSCERNTVNVLDCFSILSLICGASLMVECCLNKTWSIH